MQEYSNSVRHLDKTIVFVPTMGFFHKGHLSLINEGRKFGDKLIVSIFVNPVQFGPEEDFESYPRNIEKDIGLAKKEGADIVFIPDKKELYPQRFQTYANLKELPNHLCGLSRPALFSGVATIVVKLFNIVKPHVAIFGKKDYQQFVIIRQIVLDLNFDIKIVGVATVRESDGLAMSSRNSYLTDKQRVYALSICKSLKKAQELFESGINDAARIIETASKLIKSYPETVIDYIAICDPETLVDIKRIDRQVLMAIAVKVGNTRLIDNIILNPDTKEGGRNNFPVPKQRRNS